MSGLCGACWRQKRFYRVLVGKLEVKRPLRKLIREGKYNIKKNLQEVGWSGVDWICMAQDKNW